MTSSRGAASLQPVGFFLLRTPLLPRQVLADLARGLTAPGVKEKDALESALNEDRARVRERMRGLLAAPEVQEALFLASASLHASYPLWLEAPESERGRRVELSLVRYLERMAARCTPFGLFAGITRGTIGERTTLTLQGLAHYRRATRLEVDYLWRLSEALAKDPSLQDKLLLFPNSSLYRAGDRLRYVEAGFEKGARAHRLVAVEPTPFLEAALTAAASGARLGQLVSAVQAVDDSLTFDEVRVFVGELVSSQLLVHELTPSPTGEDPLAAVLHKVRRHGAPAAEPLGRVSEGLAALDRAPLGQPRRRYEGLAQTLATLPGEAELSRLFHVDLLKPGAQVELGADVCRQLAQLVDWVARLRPVEDPLAEFRRAFHARYEEREVRLIEVLDEESGIGAAGVTRSFDPAPLLDDLPFPSGPSAATLGPLERLLLEKVLAARQTGAREVELTVSELEKLAEASRGELPEACSVLVRLLEGKGGRPRLVFLSALGPSGAELLGRFGSLDSQLLADVRALAAAEEQAHPEEVFAELLHLPQGRVGNVIYRPRMRAHELPFLSNSEASPEQQLALTDLWVSIVEGRVRLRSERLGREVHPRLTNAHNHQGPDNLALYRFLGLLQSQGRPRLGFSWGSLSTLSSLPRVVCGEAVLAPAQWRLSAEQVKALTAPGARGFLAWQALREAWQLPRDLLVGTGDELLPLDLDNVLSLEAAAVALAGPEAVLTEQLCGGALAQVTGPEGLYENELLIPLRRAAAAASASPLPAPPAGGPRTFPPGSEWLYLKLYGGTANADRVLLEAVAPAVRALRESEGVQGWFFLRYADPEPHVRVRLRGDPRRLAGEALARLHQGFAPLLAQGLLFRVQLDTYERELERYGGPPEIDLAEALFEADSEAVLSLLGTPDAEPAQRWLAALLGLDRLMEDFELDLAARAQLMEARRQSYAAETKGGAALERKIGERFRRDRSRIDEALDPTRSPLSASLAAFVARSERVRPLAVQLRAALQGPKVQARLDERLSSFLHMFVVRWLPSRPREQERVLYELLARHYDSALARKRKAAPAVRPPTS